jgi:hypothetical protein
MKAVIDYAKIMAIVIGGSMLWASVFAIPAYIIQQERMQQHGE